MEMTFRECGDCHACCDGYLTFKVYGNSFGNGKECFFLVNNACSIYNDRPKTCSYYQCAWSQKLLPEWMKPNKCNVMVSVEVDTNQQQFLRVIEMNEFIDEKVYDEIKKFVDQNNSYFVKNYVKKIIPIKYES